MTIKTVLIVAGGALALTACSKAPADNTANVAEANVVAPEMTSNAVATNDTAMNVAGADNAANSADGNSSDDAQSSGGVVLKQ